MPQQWFERMATIKTYEQDASAMGRINAWNMAFNLAKDRPLGGGFDAFQWDMFAALRAGSRRRPRLAQHLFRSPGRARLRRPWAVPALGLMTWLTASWVIRQAAATRRTAGPPISPRWCR